MDPDLGDGQHYITIVNADVKVAVKGSGKKRMNETIKDCQKGTLKISQGGVF